MSASRSDAVRSRRGESRRPTPRSDALAERLGCIAHGAIERRKHGPRRDQPKSMRDVAHLGELSIDALEVYSQAALK